MKGFLYLVEIAVAAILVAMVLGSILSAQNVSIDWTRADLVGVGNNLFDSIGNDIVNVLNGTEIQDTLYTLKPPNVKYTMRFRGIPKETINVGTNNLPKVQIYLEEAYLNNRFIRFNVIQFNAEDSLDDFDVLVLYDYDYDGGGADDYNDPRLKEFSKDKVIIGLEDEDTSASNFKDFFGLDTVSPAVTPEEIGFNNYGEIAKYFHGIGFTIKTFDSSNDGYWGKWYLKNLEPLVKINAGGDVCISPSGSSQPPTCDLSAGSSERETISYNGVNYLIKDVEYPNKVYFGIKDDNFDFASNFAGGSVKAGNLSENIIGRTGANEYAAMTRYENRIWISKRYSNVPDQEYSALVKAAVASSVMDWYFSKPKVDRTIEISRYVPLCCDIAETAEMSFVLWYVF